VTLPAISCLFPRRFLLEAQRRIYDPKIEVPSMSDAAPNDFLLLIVSSPSGAGKTTLCNRLRDEYPEIRFSVSHTTRKPRVTEVNGREYHFVDVPTFEAMVQRNAFAEWAKVHDSFYGTSLAEIEAARCDPTARGVLFDIDYQGARQIKAAFPDAVAVFILPPSLAELARRLRGRGTEDEASAIRRLDAAKGEIEHYGIFDYVVVNDDLRRADAALRALVIAERCRRARHALLCERMLAEGKVNK
jgi:guanylate kinase